MLMSNLGEMVSLYQCGILIRAEQRIVERACAYLGIPTHAWNDFERIDGLPLRGQYRKAKYITLESAARIKNHINNLVCAKCGNAFHRDGTRRRLYCSRICKGSAASLNYVRRNRTEINQKAAIAYSIEAAASGRVPRDELIGAKSHAWRGGGFKACVLCGNAATWRSPSVATRCGAGTKLLCRECKNELVECVGCKRKTRRGHAIKYPSCGSMSCVKAINMIRYFNRKKTCHTNHTQS